MYFKSRSDAGKQIAKKLAGYQNENCAVLALSEGGVIVGAQIAMLLHANMALLLTEKITIPGELNPLAAVSASGNFTYNNMFSTGQLEEFTGEYRHFIEQSRLEKIHRLHHVMGDEGEIDINFLKRRVVILVSDGLSSGFSLDIAADFLKPLKMKRLIVATPIASVPAVDRMHLLADEICCLSVLDNYIDTDHYYEDNTIPNYEGITKIIRNISLNWQSK